MPRLTWRLLRPTILGGLAAALPLLALAQVPRTDTATCALPGGHRIELKSRYLWLPVNPHPRSDRTHHDQGAYSVRLRPAGGRPITLTEDSDRQAMAPDVAAYKCSGYGAQGSIVFSLHDLVLLPSGERLPTQALYRMGVASSKAEYSETHQRLLKQEALAYPAGWAFGLDSQGTLLAEQGFYDAVARGQITAVLRFTSADQGKTWHEQGLARSSTLFDLGKPWEAQAFVGRAVKVNGKALSP